MGLEKRSGRSRSERSLLFSVTRRDLEVETFTAGGKGGQNQHRVRSGVRVRHPASGAVAESRESRDQKTNKRLAFARMVRTKEFIAWHRREVDRRLGLEQEIGRAVEEAMHPANTRVEYWLDRKRGWQAGDAAGSARRSSEP